MWKDVMKQMKHHETVKDMLLGNYETSHFSRAWHAVFWMNHYSEIQLDSGCPSLVMTDILQQLIGVYSRDQSVLHRCCKILVYFSHQKYHMFCPTILLAPGRFGPMTSFIERSSRTDRRWVASFIFSEHFLVEAKSCHWSFMLEKYMKLYHTWSRPSVCHMLSNVWCVVCLE